MSIARTHRIFCSPDRQENTLSRDVKKLLTQFTATLPDGLAKTVNALTNNSLFKQLLRDPHLIHAYQNQSLELFHHALRRTILSLLPTATLFCLLPVASAQNSWSCSQGAPTNTPPLCDPLTTNALGYALNVFLTNENSTIQPQACFQLVSQATGMGSYASSAVESNIETNINATILCQWLISAFSNASDANLTHFALIGPSVGNWLSLLNGTAPQASLDQLQNNLNQGVNSTAYLPTSGLSTTSIAVLAVALVLAAMIISGAVVAHCHNANKKKEQEANAAANASP